MASTSIRKLFKSRDKAKKTEEKNEKNRERMFPLPLRQDCRGGSIKHVGNFYTSGLLEANLPNTSYQLNAAAASAQAQEGPGRSTGQRLGGSEESWQRLQPVVECGDDAMTLTVRRRRAAQLRLDPVNESSVPLSQLPPECGYSVETTWKDLSLIAQYDACHVSQEADSYVLPLLWRKTPVKMSCPASHILPVGPSALCCSPDGMTVKVQGLSAAEELRVNVRGEWTPLEMLAEQCGYTLDRADDEIVITAPFITCGITMKDGKYTLSLQPGGMTFTLACPVSPTNKRPAVHQPLVNSPPHLPRKHAPESLEPLPWAPPFYLAPPNYPHPTYRHKHLSPDVFNTPTPSSLTPDPAISPQPLPHVDSQPGYQDSKHFGVHSSLSTPDDLEDSIWLHPDVQQPQTPVVGLFEKHSATHTPPSEAGFPVQVEAPPHQSPHHAFSQYYHYYHHPKIPLLDPGPEALKQQSLTHPHHLKFPVFPPSIQQSEALRVDQSLQPTPEAASHPHTLPSNAPYPPQPYPYHYLYYSPLITKGEVKRSAPLKPDTIAKTNLSDYDNTMLTPYMDQPKPDKTHNFHPFLTEDDVKAWPDGSTEVTLPLPPSYPPGLDAGGVLPHEPLSFPTAAPIPYPYLYHPYYYYYQLYYRPESLHSADNLVSSTSSEETLDPPLQTSPPQHLSLRKQQTTVPSTEPTSDVHGGGLHPLYYYYSGYYPYYWPKMTYDGQELHPADGVNSKSESPPLSDSDNTQMDRPVHVTEVAYPSMPQPGHSPFHSLYSLYLAQQRLYDSFRHPDGEEVEERLDEDVKDQLKANLPTPSASLCGFGPVSDFDCSLGCCSYLVKGESLPNRILSSRLTNCTMGQYLIFAVVETMVAPSTHPSEVSNVSCTMQKLTSDPDIYIVHLDSCRGSEHVCGYTVVHPLEDCGFHFLQQAHRLMEECSSSPGSPGGVRLHVMDWPPPPPVQSAPATATVRLRIATDESFTSFYPEVRLPLSLLRGTLVYLEVSLLDPPEPSLVLLVHSCLAYTQAPYTSWILIYDGCSSGADSQLLPSAHSDHKHIQRILVSSFLSVPSASPQRGSSHEEDPEIYFLCLTEVCSLADHDCALGCINSPDSV